MFAATLSHSFIILVLVNFPITRRELADKVEEHFFLVTLTVFEIEILILNIGYFFI